MTRRYSSTAQATTLAAGCTSAATSIQVSATTGFPAVDFVLALDYGAAGQELVLVTNVAGTTLTVTRGYNSTPAAAHSLGAAVRHVHAAQDFTDSRTHEAATTAVHGIAGAVVGTTDVQVLSNKDLSAGTNTFPASLATDAEVTSAVSTHAALTVAHGATGAVVGTTNAQTLTNKTIDLASNTLTGTKAQFNAALTGEDFATLAAVETLTNKTLTAPTLNTPTLTSPVIDTLAGVTGVGQRRHLKKGLDESLASNAVLQSDDELAFSVVAAGEYLISGFINATQAGGGISYAFALPAGATLMILPSGDTFSGIPSFGLSSGSVFAALGSTKQPVVQFTGKIVVAGTAGTATLQWAQNASNAGVTTVKAGSFIDVERVA